MLAAERLFGEYGIGAVSLRAVCQAAGQRNIVSVQYHFGDRNGLIRAILWYREGQLEPLRKKLLDEAYHYGRIDDVETLIRILFEPYMEVFIRRDDISYIKLVLSYLVHVRPVGTVLHPVDEPDIPFPSLTEVMTLLRRRLSFLKMEVFDSRSETVGAMFYGGIIQFSARNRQRDLDRQVFFDDLMEMMAAAFSSGEGHI
ncbi:TetR/AcrR family transcriptional regulator [Flavisphingomonas formosensis]|uniref:TetR/AcrR family transcriptional regulator n=1 Tax=Flavisphingomonas formosensis TaxID=861534 RepID=UPI0018E0067C|nr:TetR/AcrR family transcriptional regulator [Sphingomonas formosensis]